MKKNSTFSMRCSERFIKVVDRLSNEFDMSKSEVVAYCVYQSANYFKMKGSEAYKSYATNRSKLDERYRRLSPEEAADLEEAKRVIITTPWVGR